MLVRYVLLSGWIKPDSINLNNVDVAALWWRSTSTAPDASLVIASSSVVNVVISTLTPYFASNAETMSGLT